MDRMLKMRMFEILKAHFKSLYLVLEETDSFFTVKGYLREVAYLKGKAPLVYLHLEVSDVWNGSEYPTQLEQVYLPMPTQLPDVTIPTFLVLFSSDLSNAGIFRYEDSLYAQHRKLVYKGDDTVTTFCSIPKKGIHFDLETLELYIYGTAFKAMQLCKEAKL